jgi:hypothetical protein
LTDRDEQPPVNQTGFRVKFVGQAAHSLLESRCAGPPVQR